MGEGEKKIKKGERGEKRSGRWARRQEKGKREEDRKLPESARETACDAGSIKAPF